MIIDALIEFLDVIVYGLTKQSYVTRFFRYQKGQTEQVNINLNKRLLLFLYIYTCIG